MPGLSSVTMLITPVITALSNSDALESAFSKERYTWVDGRQKFPLKVLVLKGCLP